MNQNTKEQKALKVCERLLEHAKHGGSERYYAAVNLAEEVCAPDVSKTGLKAADSWLNNRPMPSDPRTVLARIIDEETHHVELRDALVSLNSKYEYFGEAKLFDQVKALIKATE